MYTFAIVALLGLALFKVVDLIAPYVKGMLSGLALISGVSDVAAAVDGVAEGVAAAAEAAPEIEATVSRTMMAPTFNLPAPHTTPTVNSRESPGRKKPTSRPLSENTMQKRARYPIQPVSTVDRS